MGCWQFSEKSYINTIPRRLATCTQEKQGKARQEDPSFHGNERVAKLLIRISLSMSKEDDLNIAKELCENGDLFNKSPEKLKKDLKFSSATNVACSKRIMALRLHDDHDPLEVDEMGRICRILDQRASRKRACRTNMYEL